MNQIKDYLQTQALKLNPDDVAVARAAAQAVIASAQAHIDDTLLRHDALPKNLAADLNALKPLFVALDAAYSRQNVQSAAIYAWLPDEDNAEQGELVRLAQLGQPLENVWTANEDTAWQSLAVRSARSGWANITEDTARWLAADELQGEHNRRAASQTSLPICGEDGVVYGVLHLESTQPLPENELAAWVGLALGVLPTMRELLPRETESEE